MSGSRLLRSSLPAEGGGMGSLLIIRCVNIGGLGKRKATKYVALILKTSIG